MKLIEKLWYERLNAVNALYLLPLMPFTALFAVAAAFRRFGYRIGWFKSAKPNLPIVVIGGICVGGSGKTPLAIAILKHLESQGIKAGLLSRGYKGCSKSYPMQVTRDANYRQCGDEPMLIKLSVADSTLVVVDPNRVRGAFFLQKLGAEVIITDDGLQHYALKRDAEIIVVDGTRLFGNGLLLPSGPLREGQSRLKDAFAVIVNGKANAAAKDLQDAVVMQLEACKPITLKAFSSGDKTGFSNLKRGDKVCALAGIGNPERFYKTLESLGYVVAKKLEAGDHIRLNPEDVVTKSGNLPVVMTAKDAVKYTDSQLVRHNCHVLEVKACLPAKFLESLSREIVKLQETYR